MPTLAPAPPATPLLIVRSGALVAELVSVVKERFSLKDLEQLARTDLDLDLYGEVCAPASLNDVAYDLVNWLNRHEGLERLLRAMGHARPDLGPVLAAYQARARNLGRGGEALAVGQAIRTVAAAAAADQDVRAEVGQFRVRFDQARTELDLLGRYKGLHDCLHQLQLQLPAIIRTARAFPTDPTSGRDLAAFLQNLELSARLARRRIPGLLTEADELAWVGEYEAALANVRAALRGPSPGQPEPVVRSLYQFLPEAFRINGLLYAAATRLIPELRCVADAIDALAKHLAAGSPDDPRLPRLRDGHQELQGVVPRLVGLVEAHNGWQQIDQALALAAALPPGRPADRVPRWPRVKTLLARHSAPAPAGTPDPVSLAEQLDTAADPVAAEPLFLDLRAVALQEFAIVDADLYALTGELTADVIQPLDVLLGVI